MRRRSRDSRVPDHRQMSASALGATLSYPPKFGHWRKVQFAVFRSSTRRMLRHVPTDATSSGVQGAGRVGSADGRGDGSRVGRPTWDASPMETGASGVLERGSQKSMKSRSLRQTGCCTRTCASRCRAGRFLGNILVERLWRSLEYERVHLHAWDTGSWVRAGVRSWIAIHTTAAHTRPIAENHLPASIGRRRG